MVKEKSSPNWLFGLGYIFVASIILMNYLYQKTEFRVSKPSSGKTTTSSSQEGPDPDSLLNKLEEERRINREMSAMINSLQASIKYGHGHDYSGDGDKKPETLPIELTFEEIMKNGLPDLIQVSLHKMGSPTPTAKRNPFLPFYDTSTQATKARKESSASPVQPTIFRLKTDPKVPLPLQNTWNVPVIFDSEYQNK